MRTLLLVSCLLLLVPGPLRADHHEGAEAEIRQLIEHSYVHGAFNELDPDAMRSGFHEDFAIFWPEGEKIGKYPIGKWVAAVEKQKAGAEFDPAQNVWSHAIETLDVTGKTAMAKVELHHDDKHVYTDYLLMLKFDSGWRIVSKVYTEHSVD